MDTVIGLLETKELGSKCLRIHETIGSFFALKWRNYDILTERTYGSENVTISLRLTLRSTRIYYPVFSRRSNQHRVQATLFLWRAAHLLQRRICSFNSRRQQYHHKRCWTWSEHLRYFKRPAVSACTNSSRLHLFPRWSSIIIEVMAGPIPVFLCWRSARNSDRHEQHY